MAISIGQGGDPEGAAHHLAQLGHHDAATGDPVEPAGLEFGFGGGLVGEEGDPLLVAGVLHPGQPARQGLAVGRVERLAQHGFVNGGQGARAAHDPEQVIEV